jgi:hypothetical protein
VHVKSLPAHAIRALIIARKKLVGQRVTYHIRGLAVVFGVRLPGHSPPLSSIKLSRQAKGSLVFLPPCRVWPPRERLRWRRSPRSTRT